MIARQEEEVFPAPAALPTWRKSTKKSGCHVLRWIGNTGRSLSLQTRLLITLHLLLLSLQSPLRSVSTANANGNGNRLRGMPASGPGPSSTPGSSSAPGPYSATEPGTRVSSGPRPSTLSLPWWLKRLALVPVDFCDFFMYGQGYTDIPIIEVSPEIGDHVYGLPLTSSVVPGQEVKVMTVNSAGCIFLRPEGLDFSCYNQFYTNGNRIASRTFNQPIDAYQSKLVLIHFSSVALENGLVLTVNDNNSEIYQPGRRCTIFWTS